MNEEGLRLEQVKYNKIIDDYVDEEIYKIESETKKKVLERKIKDYIELLNKREENKDIEKDEISKLINKKRKLSSSDEDAKK